MATIEILLDNCTQLQSIQDLNYWEAVSRQELKAFRRETKEDNFDTKYLNLNDDMINFLRGNLE